MTTGQNAPFIAKNIWESYAFQVGHDNRIILNDKVIYANVTLNPIVFLFTSLAGYRIDFKTVLLNVTLRVRMYDMDYTQPFIGYAKFDITGRDEHIWSHSDDQFFKTATLSSDHDA